MKAIPMRRKPLGALVLCCAGLAGAAQAASIQIYKQPNFTGGQVTLNAATSNLSSVGIQDQASSLVLDGSWELCSQPNFAGDCKVLDAGRYATLEQALNHRIESARPIAKAIEARGDFDREARRDEDRDTRGRDSDRSWSGRYARGDMDIFPGAGFRGRPMHLDGDAASLEEFSDRASSVVIHDGTWQLCSQPGYEGRCRTFGPGRYASLGPLDNQVASAKLIR